MDHVAIMNKKWDLIPKILDGRKKIESRWSVNKCTPWKKVNAGDRIYFKNSGELVTATAIVEKVKSFDELNRSKILSILRKYGGEGGISISSIDKTFDWIKNKRYCTLIYLKNTKTVKRFSIDKSGFGSGCAWITVGDINNIKLET